MLRSRLSGRGGREREVEHGLDPVDQELSSHSSWNFSGCLGDTREVHQGECASSHGSVGTSR